MTARVFIVMTTRNRIRTLPRAIYSVIEQTFQDWELLIINDNSIDRTKEWLDNNIVDPRIQVIKNISDSNHSIVKQNYMLASTNEYLAVLDDDDYWDSNYLEESVRTLDCWWMSPFTYTNCRLLKEDSRVELEDTSRGYPFPDILPSLCVFRGSIFRELNGWDLERYKFGNKFIHAEIDYYLRVRKLYGHPIHIPRSLVSISRNNNSMGASRELNMLGTKRLMFLWEEYLKQDRKVWSILSSRLGIHEVEYGLSGSKSFKEAIRYNPENLEAWGALILSSISRDLFLWCYSKYRELARRH